MHFRTLPLVALFLSISISARAQIRVGIVGCDTSHVPAFTKLFNDPKAEGELAGFKVVAAFPGGSQDIPSSRDRVQKFTDDLKAGGVEIVDSIPKLLEKVDVVLLESVDGRPHLGQARPVIEAKKPLFIDKPMAGSLADAVAIAELAKRNGVPWFSSSSIRFGPKLVALKSDPKLGEVVGCDAFGPCPTEEHHPDLFWYGIHGVEALYTIMGPGAKASRAVNTKGTDLVVGTWKDGRVGTFRGIRDGKADYGVVAFGKAGVVAQQGFEGYKPLALVIAKFFKTRQPPIAAEETVELMAFMEAADESKRQRGKAVRIEDVMAKARELAKGSVR
jgi:predicted dehydrogenase